MNTKTDEGESAPLHLACGAGHADLASLLLDREAHPNARDAERAAPLHHAAAAGHADVAKCVKRPLWRNSWETNCFSLF